MTKALAEALTKPVIHLAGTDTGARAAGLKELVEAAGADPLERQSIVSDEHPFEEWIALVTNLPFLGEKRVLVVRHLYRINPLAAHDNLATHPWRALLQRVPAEGMLILVADDISGDSKTVVNAWAGLLKGIAHPLSFDVAAAKFDEEIRQRAQGMGRKITNGALALLQQMTAGRLGMALGELEKLVIASEASRAIDEDLVRRIAVGDEDFKVFSLVDSVLRGDARGALDEIPTMLRRGDPMGEIYGRILPTLGSQLRSIYQASLEREMGREAEALFPSKPNLTTMKDFPRQKARDAAGRLSRAKIRQLLALLLEAEAVLKGQRPGSDDPIFVVEQMVLEMSALCAPAPRSRSDAFGEERLSVSTPRGRGSR